MNNLKLYNAVRDVPKEAQKSIGGGRLKGMTDINPMWRIKTLTDQFGPVGIGWKYIITEKWLESSPTEEIAAFVSIDLYIKHEGAWSEPIPGSGGAMFVTKEKGGLYTDDECYKKALTDAISVSCKALGIGADIYWDKDRTKYSDKPAGTEKPAPKDPGELGIVKLINGHHAKGLMLLAGNDDKIVRMAMESLGYRSSKEIPVSALKAMEEAIKKYKIKVGGEND